MSGELASPARIWNYLSGGKDYYEIDRLVGDRCIETYPDITTVAIQSLQFRIRAVHYLAGQGVGQFIDIGFGLPVKDPTHTVAQAVLPDARVVYVDHDPLVLTHARALFTSTTAEGILACIDSDVRGPERIIADAKHTLNSPEPIAVLLMGVLDTIEDYTHAITQWRTPDTDIGEIRSVSAYGAAARKPG
ncbi:SAM-dependent methyltransferase [Nocardia beijingensis]|uniref:SAM-dependent methyltransferase n=1 Tax=Nocardia beijingensis TaxID=95162 RepID=UPI00344B1959